MFTNTNKSYFYCQTMFDLLFPFFVTLFKVCNIQTVLTKVFLAALRFDTAHSTSHKPRSSLDNFYGLSPTENLHRRSFQHG